MISIFSFHFQGFHSFFRIFRSFTYSSFFLIKSNRVETKIGEKIQETELSSVEMNIKYAIDFSGFVNFLSAIKFLQLCSMLIGILLL